LNSSKQTIIAGIKNNDFLEDLNYRIGYPFSF
jgi:hypothetical protein